MTNKSSDTELDFCNFFSLHLDINEETLNVPLTFRFRRLFRWIRGIVLCLLWHGTQRCNTHVLFLNLEHSNLLLSAKEIELTDRDGVVAPFSVLTGG